MGCMIVRITSGNTRYIAWAEDSTPIAPEMAKWLQHGQTMEILDYRPNTNPHSVHLIPELNLWGDHLKEEDNDRQATSN